MRQKKTLTLRDIRNRKVKRRYDYYRRYIRVAAAIDWRWSRLNRKQLWFVFRGLPHPLAVKVFKSLVGKRHAIAGSAYIKSEHDIMRRNCHGFYRVAVMIIAPDWHFSELETMKTLIAGTISRLHPSRVKWLKLKDFLNI